MARMSETVSGRAAAYRGRSARPRGPAEAGWIRAPRWSSGPNSRRPNSNAVTTPKFGAGAADAPEELRLLRLARPDRAAVGGHELDGPQVVDRQPEVALQPAHAAAERQAGDSGVADHADRADEAVRLGRDIELAEERAAVRPGDRAASASTVTPRIRDMSMTRPPSVVEWPRRAVAAGADSDLEIVLAPEPDRRRDVRDARRADEERGPPVEHRVPDAAGLVVDRRRSA